MEIVKKKEGFVKMQMNKYVSQKVEYERLTGDFLWWHLGNPIAIKETDTSTCRKTRNRSTMST